MEHSAVDINKKPPNQTPTPFQLCTSEITQQHITTMLIITIMAMIMLNSKDRPRIVPSKSSLNENPVLLRELAPRNQLAGEGPVSAVDGGVTVWGCLSLRGPAL